MGLFDWLGLKGRGHDVDELARRLGIAAAELTEFDPRYREFSIPKRRGGKRIIHAPHDDLKALQRRILRRVLSWLRAHRCATGFERGQSIVTNALPHVGREVVVRLDLVDFFPSTRADRVEKYFRRVGWNRPAAALLTRLCTHNDGLPQGAPTSPRLSNLLNHRVDARIDAMAHKLGVVYTRYADDITFSFAANDRAKIHYLRSFVERVVQENGYRLHHRRKAHVRRRHHQQLVTGLVVNDRANLPRKVRRWLRAVEHRAASSGDWRTRDPSAADYFEAKEPSLTASQIEGWRALVRMIERQAGE